MLEPSFPSDSTKQIMSERLEAKFGWQLTQIQNKKFKDSDIKILLQNRGYILKDADNQNLKKTLTTNFFVEDSRLLKFDAMTINQLKPELKLRNLDHQYGGKHGKKQEMVTRLKNRPVPSSPEKVPENGYYHTLVTYGYIRENQVVLERGLFIPCYLTEIIKVFANKNRKLLYLNQNYLLISCVRSNNTANKNETIISKIADVTSGKNKTFRKLPKFSS